jgi:small subunit ribosomal protein S18
MASTTSRPPQRQQSSGPQQRGDSSRAPKRQHRKVCSFCVEKINYIDYKEISRLRRFVSDRGKILPRRVTGTCAKHQRPLTTALERARAIALLPYTTETH